MLRIAATACIVLVLLLLNEWWWHGRKHGEASRKFVHVTVGTFVAFWPLFLSWQQIELLSLAFFVVVLASWRWNIFRAIHSVQRPTWGELYFALAVGLVALFVRQPAVYAAALLHMSVADGLAAIVGSRFGSKHRYKVFGAWKSWLGTATFLVSSLVILVGYSWQQGQPLGWLSLLAVAAALLENVAVRGLDNLLVPLAVAAVLGLAAV